MINVFLEEQFAEVLSQCASRENLHALIVYENYARGEEIVCEINRMFPYIKDAREIFTTHDRRQTRLSFVNNSVITVQHGCELDKVSKLDEFDEILVDGENLYNALCRKRDEENNPLSIDDLLRDCKLIN